MTKRTMATDLFGAKIRKSGINGRAKGGTNERICGKWLLRWTGEPFARVPSSGGLRWKNHSSVCGDLVCENEEFDFIFSVETKHLKELYTPVKLPKASNVLTIWKQAERDAERARKHPIAVLRRNGMPEGTYIVFVEDWIAKYLTRRGLTIISQGGGIAGFNSEDFITVPYEELKEFINIKVTLTKNK